jgi:hypothetical protein
MALRGFVSFIILAALHGCGRLDSIDYSPKVTPEEFLGSQPHLHVRLSAVDFMLIQPSSTVIVYFVALLTMAVGLYFLQLRNNQRSRLWWGFGLLLSGFGALLAGTSYQAFGYEIKCAGREFCAWTSWWEVAYLIFTAAGMNAMLVAVACSCTAAKFRRIVSAYALVSAVAYVGAVLTGALVPVRFLVSFECLMLAAVPSLVLALVLTGRVFLMRRDAASLALLGAWAGLVMVMAAYVLAQSMDITHRLAPGGIWFTENDVLHTGMILWALYVAAALPKRVEDYHDPATRPEK